ncbi:MAG: diheme cytochrome c-553 [Phaeodactylibacter sp.]|nr:diheme cytochrome c-553 [Phaeodactylibacter sp.]MCB9277109.1 diheme cytochrome c-553 [Lewinellaceae bacterium]
MKTTRLLIASLALAAMAGGILTACQDAHAKTQADSQPESMSQEQLVKRGAYLVSAIGCDDCHSPKVFGPNGPEPDMERRFSGYQEGRPLPEANKDALKDWVLFAPDLTAAVGPWGTSFAANITSDGTGIGNWTEEQFFRAIREGKSKGLANSRSLLPPMPWPVYRNMSDDDLRAIFAYLKSTKPVHNIVPQPVPPGGVQ